MPITYTCAHVCIYTIHPLVIIDIKTENRKSKVTEGVIRVL